MLHICEEGGGERIPLNKYVILQEKYEFTQKNYRNTKFS